MLHHSNTSFLNQEGSPFEFGELEEAIVNKINIIDESTNQSLYSTAVRPAAATLEMFPSWPLNFHQGSSRSGGEESSGGSGSGKTCSSDRRLPPPQMGGADSDASLPEQETPPKQTSDKRKGSGSNPNKVLDAKTLRRLAQNREAARKSRLRKKAYVQQLETSRIRLSQLETSRIRLSQLEQDLQRARSQGIFLERVGAAGGNISSGGVIFDMEYARWLDDDHRHRSELRTALQAHLTDSDMRVMMDEYIAHYDEIFQLKGIAAKSDVFHLFTGMWATPAERCFMWVGGFRPSELIKMLIGQLDPLTEQQIMGIYSLQQSSQQAEEALLQGLEQLQLSLIDTIASSLVDDSMHHMAIALGKLANLEGFVRQADNLRQQTLHQLRRVLTVRQAGRCFLAIGEYYDRLRALSSLWAS